LRSRRKARKTFSLALGAILLMCGGALRAQTDLVANPGFEKDEDANGIPDGWTFDLVPWSGSKGTMDWDETQRRSGKRSAKIQQDNAKGRMAVKSLMIPVKPSAKYAFSGWMKTRFEKDGEPRAYFFFVGYKNGKLVRQLQNTMIVKATTDWTEYKLNVRFGANIDAIVINAVIAPGPGTIWIDDLSFSEVKAGVAAPAKRAETNLVSNGDFETDEDKNGIPDHWRTRNPATATWTTEYASSGKRCIKAAKDGYWLQGDLPVVPGRRMCAVSFNAMTDKFGQRMRVYCEANKGGRFLMLGTFTDRGEGNRVWHKKKFTFRMPDPAVVDRFYIVLMALDGTVWFDDVRISTRPEEVAQAPASPMEIELTKPYWRNTIYARSRIARASCFPGSRSRAVQRTSQLRLSFLRKRSRSANMRSRRASEGRTRKSSSQPRRCVVSVPQGARYASGKTMCCSSTGSRFSPSASGPRGITARSPRRASTG